jgi:hypothetical protein
VKRTAECQRLSGVKKTDKEGFKVKVNKKSRLEIEENTKKGIQRKRTKVQDEDKERRKERTKERKKEKKERKKERKKRKKERKGSHHHSLSLPPLLPTVISLGGKVETRKHSHMAACGRLWVSVKGSVGS